MASLPPKPPKHDDGAASLPPPPPPPSKPIKVALLGFGSAARTFHIPLITSLPNLFHLHTIQQRPGSKSGPAVASVPSLSYVNVVADVEEALEKLPKPGLVVVTTANETHVPFAVKALEAGHHVVVEKPAALTLADAQKLASLAREKGLVCSTFQNRRFDGDFLTLQSLLDAGSPSNPSPLGLPTNVVSRFDRFRPTRKGGWREEKGFEQGGGLLWDLGSHLADQALVLFGPPAHITALLQSKRDATHSVEDDFLVVLSYATTPPLPPEYVSPPAGTRLGGLRVTLGASCLAPFRDEEQLRWRVEGVRGSYEKRGLDAQESQLKAGRTPANDADEFGAYDDASDPDSLRLGRLTISDEVSADSGGSGGAAEGAGAKVEPGAGQAGGAAAAPPAATAQPVLLSRDVPTLPGRYIDYYRNVGETIQAVEAVASKLGGGGGGGGGGGDDDDDDEASAKASLERRNAVRDARLAVRPEQTVETTRLIRLAWRSAREARSVAWDEEVP